MYDAQVSTLEALNRLAQQRVVFEGQVADEISSENDILREQLNIANKQNDGRLKNLAQQRELNKVNNQTLGIARSIQSVTASELGSQKLIEKIQKDRLKVQKNIDFLQKSAQKTYTEAACAYPIGSATRGSTGRLPMATATIRSRSNGRSTSAGWRAAGRSPSAAGPAQRTAPSRRSR